MASLTRRALACWALLSCAAAPARAQAPTAAMHMRMVSAPTHVRITREDAGLLLDIGPVDALASRDGGDPMYLPPAMPAIVPVDGWARGYSVRLVDGNGRAVPLALLHHVNVLQPDKRQLFSPIMMRVAAASTDTPPITMPRVIGYRVHAGDTLMVSLMLHNPTGTDYRGVHVLVLVPFSPASSWVPVLSVVPFWMDVTPPTADHALNLPPGRSVFSWEGRPAISGRVLGMGGHLHKYGRELRLEDTTEHKIIWSVKPDTDARGDVKDMPLSRFFWRLGLPLHADHVYRLVAVYDNPTGDMIPEGAMGTLGGIFVPARGESMPPVDRNDPAYKWDVHYSLDPPDSLRPMKMKMP